MKPKNSSDNKFKTVLEFYGLLRQNFLNVSGLPALSESYLVLPALSESYLVLPALSESYLVLPALSGKGQTHGANYLTSTAMTGYPAQDKFYHIVKRCQVACEITMWTTIIAYPKATTTPFNRRGIIKIKVQRIYGCFIKGTTFLYSPQLKTE